MKVIIFWKVTFYQLTKHASKFGHFCLPKLFWKQFFELKPQVVRYRAVFACLWPSLFLMISSNNYAFSIWVVFVGVFVSIYTHWHGLQEVGYLLKNDRISHFGKQLFKYFSVMSVAREAKSRFWATVTERSRTRLFNGSEKIRMELSFFKKCIFAPKTG